MSSLKDIEESGQEENSKKIFFKYLKALSSRATLIVVKFSQPELKTILSSEKFKIKQANSLEEIVNDQKEKPEEENLVGFQDYFLKHVILLETRLAKNIPNYDFSKMKNDERIRHYEMLVEKKLNGHCSKDN